MEFHRKVILAVFIILVINLFVLNMSVKGEGGGFFFTYWTSSDGIFYQTLPNGNNITLNWTDVTNTSYETAGDYISANIDAGKIVMWDNITWGRLIPPETSILMRVEINNGTPSGDFEPSEGFSAGYGSFGIFTDDSRVTRYIRYKADLTGNSTVTPYLEDVTINYTTLHPRAFASGTPGVSTDGDINLSCVGEQDYTGKISLVNVSLYTNISGGWELNETQGAAGSGFSTNVFEMTGLADGSYEWGCLVWNNNTDFTWSSNNTFTVSLGAINPDAPVITDTTIDPALVLVGENVSIKMSAYDDLGLLDTLWITITDPNSTAENIILQNNTAINYTADLSGTYNVLFHANDTAGNEANTTGSFVANELITFNISVIGYDDDGIDINLTIYLNGEEEFSGNSSEGNFTGLVLVDGTYDFYFQAYNGLIRVRLNDLVLSDNLDKEIGFDRPVVPPSGYREAWGVETDYDFDDATVRMYYDENAFTNESYLGVSECDDWNFSGRVCEGNWSDMEGLNQNYVNDYFEFDVDGFSGFGVFQDIFCGNGVCDEGEDNVTCYEDCQCNEGDNRSCGTTDEGECRFGIQVCEDGEWGDCEGDIGPVNETCNQLDDDCDGIIDDVDGGNSVSSTRCACYNGATAASSETAQCDGIDNDCDEEIDEYVTRSCGPSSDQVNAPDGICEFGTSACNEGSWGECIGPVYAADSDICGDGLDNDCDGLVDESCPTCSDGIRNGDEEGVDCGGGCPNECFVFPLDIFITLAVVIGGILVAAFLAFTFLKQKKVTWAELEEKYPA